MSRFDTGPRAGAPFFLLSTLDARPSSLSHAMFSHVVIFWTYTDKPGAADALIAGAEKYLRPIPGVSSFHAGRMVSSHRDVVDQSYQVALNIQFANKQLQDEYQVHPLHLEFVEKAFKPNCARAVVYDFE
jgi:hypothetical protein